MKTPPAPARNAGTKTARKGPVSASTGTNKVAAKSAARKVAPTATKKRRLTRPEIRERDALRAAAAAKTKGKTAGTSAAGHANAKKKPAATSGKGSSGTAARTPGKSTGMGLKKTA